MPFTPKNNVVSKFADRIFGELAGRAKRPIILEVNDEATGAVHMIQCTLNVYLGVFDRPTDRLTGFSEAQRAPDPHWEFGRPCQVKL